MVEEIHKSPCYGYIVETGAGSTISNYLLSFPGASKTIEACFTPYSKEHVESTLQMDLSKVRAISADYAEILSRIPLVGTRAKYLFETLWENFFVLTSTFQISSTPNVSTHGWMSLTTPDLETPNLYHFTLPPLTHDMDISKYRKYIMDLVAKIGASVIYRNMVKHIDVPFMDTCVEDGVNQPLEVIKSLLVTPIDMGVVFGQDGKTTRLESICRGNDVLIFKGSFNPPHKAHIEMMETCVKSLGVQGHFSISLETFGKGVASAEDILHRISMINELGYSVVINKNPLFRDFVNLFNNRMDKESKLHFVMGEDTALRFIVNPDDIDHCPSKIENGETFKQECIYHVFKRTGEPLELPSKFKVYEFNVPTSSSFVREHLNFDYLDSKTIKYITKNKLYQSEK